MIFWDTSAVVALLTREQHSEPAWDLFERDRMMLVWWATPVECLAAIARREREGRYSPQEAEQVRQDLSDLAETWVEIFADEQVREFAGRLVRRHPLRAADALQLGAALTWTDGRPNQHALATLDARLAKAARGEGFRLPLAAPGG